MQNKNIIKSEDLQLSNIPLPNADISVINLFALTFNIREGQNFIELDSDIIPDNIPDLRAVLYSTQRRWNHFGREYDQKTEERIRKILSKIRLLVEIRDSYNNNL